MTIAFLTRYLSGKLGAPVQDSTGLTGKHDIDLSWAADPAIEALGPYVQHSGNSDPEAVNAPSGVPSIFESIRKTLGLRLESRKVQEDVLVIDHVEPVPTEY